MCGLCGLLGITHWTETSAHSAAFTGDSRKTLRAERLHRTNLVNAILHPKRVRISDFQATSYLLSSPTGKTIVVDDIQAVWGAYETLTGHNLDPLDPEYLKILDQASK